MNDNFKKAVLSILIGVAIMVLNQVFSLLLEFLKAHQAILVPTVTSMIHFLKKGDTNPFV